MTKRVAVAVIALLVIYVVSERLKGRGMPTELATLQMSINQMPKEFGSWTGEDSAVDAEVFKAIGAKEVINRVYHDPKGASITLHSAVFLEYGVQGVPHPPEICYPSAGYHIDDTRTVDLETDGPGGTHPAHLLTFEKDSHTIYCMYWYSFGDLTAVDGAAQRKLILGFRGRTVWPPLVKIMLQTTAGSADEAEKRLKEIAGPAYAWAKTFH